MPPIVAIQFSLVGKRYHFDARGITDLCPGDRVVVETSRGRQLGIVSGYVPEDEMGGRVCKPIERVATARDLVMQQEWQTKALPALVKCRELAEKQGLKGYKFIKAEYNFDGSQITILFTTDKKGAELADLKRELRKELGTRIELFQIGPRDLAKELEGLGACGIPRCCSQFLTKFDSVSIRMAKVQQISLTPSEVTGLCGRLRCCLAYEHEQYSEAAKGLPKRGKEVVTPHGAGRVVEVRTLAGVLVVEVEGVRHIVDREDIGKTEFTHPPEKKPKIEWIPAELPAEKPEPEKEPKPAPPVRESKKRARPRRGRRRTKDRTSGDDNRQSSRDRRKKKP
ncbi:MAG: hypothetical protein JXA42_05150 [Anaerolineales bacterium]|nr:hypothetical protein [Anaerolineales bacterium]